MSPLLLLFFVATVPALCNFWKLFRRHSVKLLFVYFCLPIREDKIVTTCIANWGNKSKRRPPPRQHRWHQRHKHRHWIQKTSTAGRCWMREYRTSFIKTHTQYRLERRMVGNNSSHNHNRVYNKRPKGGEKEKREGEKRIIVPRVS